ncbi:hypothetical protein [Blautia glucerasea]
MHPPLCGIFYPNLFIVVKLILPFFCEEKRRKSL